MRKLSMLCVLVFTSLANPAGAQQRPATSQPSAPAAAGVPLDAARAQSELAKERYEQTIKSLDETRRALREQSGLVEATPDAVHQLAQHLQEQREALEVEEAGATGRRVGIEEAIDRVSIEAAKRSASDEVSAELKKVVEARQKNLDRLQQIRQSVTQEALDTAASELAASRAELAAARQRAAGPAGDALDAWNRELLNLSIATQERQQKLKFINARLDKLSPTISALDQLERQIHEVGISEREMDRATAFEREMEIVASRKR